MKNARHVTSLANKWTKNWLVFQIRSIFKDLCDVARDDIKVSFVASRIIVSFEMSKFESGTPDDDIDNIGSRNLTGEILHHVRFHLIYLPRLLLYFINSHRMFNCPITVHFDKLTIFNDNSTFFQCFPNYLQCSSTLSFISRDLKSACFFFNFRSTSLSNSDLFHELLLTKS